ncbi:putative DNA polymerase III subunit alpha (plasmid) [Selenomonas ruminantium subsp. lactilytica TAM6421]|uniref:Putative DNA polymerase III subunit alpha n=2 Tax=Selenomonas ruminantium TaxID=971 RepID=I0GVC2_SELRL|nr:putative DNA polymerase III subunit alpha [Selenomonas ruminantium subsp. lactilytica TAM6421]
MIILFIGLHRHSHYSKRDAIAKIPDMVERIGELGQSAWALTDHGTTSGLMEAYKVTQKYNKQHNTNIKFIFGCEMYWTPNVFIKDRKATCHLLVLARNEVGYKNLLRLTTIGYGDKGKRPDQYFYNMRVTTEDMVECKDGLIFTSACMGGVLNPKVYDGIDWDKNLAYERATKFKGLFGDSFYLEIQCSDTPTQREYNRNIIQMGKDLDIPVIVTEDSHYVNQHEADIHRKWLGVEIEPDNPDAYYQTDDYFIHSEEQVREAIGYLPADTVDMLIDNTLKLADSIETVHLKFGGKNFPELDLGGKTPLEAVKEKCRAGWKKKMQSVPRSEWPVYVEQLEHEFKVLEKCDYLTYFLMTEDFISWARSQNIRMGIGRGSVGGCLVAYLMDITRIDPIKYGLIFERFAHDKRVSLPDVDIDMPNSRRQDCIQYLVDKYKEVFHVRTFGKMAEKASIQRAARSLNYTPEEVRALSKAVSSIDEVSDPELRQLAKSYQGIIQNYGCHASAVMLFPSDANQWTAIEKQGDDYVCAYEYHDLEAMGLLKEDCLGIKTLDCIDECVRLVKEHHGVDVDVDALPDDDEKTFKMLQKLDVKGCFQIESGGMIKLIDQMKPTSVFDLVPLVALYRPSTIQSGMLDSFVNRRAGTEKTIYLHDKLKGCLSETYGVLLYQEQAMKIVQVMAGYDLGVADMFRRAIGRKIPSEMAELIPKFVKDGEALGIDARTMNKLAEWLTNCAAYQFNKSHSAAYGVTCYQTAYLKAHYPAEYLTAFLNAYKGDKQEDLLPYVRDAKEHGIKILPPSADSDTCGWTCGVDADGQPWIRVALNFISGVGDLPVPLDKDSYLKLPRDKVENLTKAGALDFVGDRAKLLEKLYKGGQLERLQKQLDTAAERQEKNRILYESAKEGTKKKEDAKRKMLKYSEQKWDIQQRIDEVNALNCKDFDQSKAEMEVLGMTFVDVFAGYDLSKYSTPEVDENGKPVESTPNRRIVLGCVRRWKPWKQKNGKPMAFFSIECPDGRTYDLVMFNYVYAQLELNKVYGFVLQGNKFKKTL